MKGNLSFTLNEAERALLERMLTSALGDTRVETRRTEFSSKLHDELHEEERLIEGLLTRMREVSAPTT